MTENTHKPAPINRPLTDDERWLMGQLAVNVLAANIGGTHTEDDCKTCDAAKALMYKYIDKGEVHLTGDAVDAYLSIDGTSIVHVERDWLAFHAEHPEAIDLDRHTLLRPSSELTAEANRRLGDDAK